MLITNPTLLKKYSTEHRVWQGIPGIVCTKGGRVFVSFYSGQTKETYGNYAMVVMSEDGVHFGEPIAVAEKAGKFRCFDPVLWIDPLHRLWFIWNAMPGEEVMGSICDDPDAKNLTWSEPFLIGRGIMMNKPTVLSSGEWLFPIAVWRKDIFREYRACAYTDEDVAGAYVYKTSDNGKSFVRLGMADVSDRSYDEHMVLEQKNGTLMMLVRTNYGIGVSYSYDRGKNWNHGSDSRLGGPCSRFFITRLRSGRVLLINHYQYKKRDHLTALLSEDDGKTYPYTLLLDERANVSYPDAMEAEDGYLYITYDRERGAFKSSLSEAYECAREILTAKITEEDILCGEVRSAEGYLKNVISKLGVLSSEDGDPYVGELMEDKDVAAQLIAEGGDNIIGLLFERYPINCINVCNFDAKQLDRLIERFRTSNCQDVNLLVEIIGHLRRAPSKKQEISPVIERIKAYVHEHLTEEFSLSDIADHIHISIYYLSHLFKTVTGTTVQSYRNELRLTQAKQLLLETELPVGEIAQRVGFSGAAYFTEVFSKSEKIPPTEYRKYHKKG
jgi:AraC-like DNA-binding protein